MTVECPHIAALGKAGKKLLTFVKEIGDGKVIAVDGTGDIIGFSSLAQKLPNNIVFLLHGETVLRLRVYAAKVCCVAFSGTRLFAV